MLHTAYLEFFKAFTLLLTASQDLPLPEAREASKQFFTQGVTLEAIAKAEDQAILGPDKNLIGLRILAPQATQPLPVVVFFHSGGWVFGCNAEAEPLCRKIANRAGCIFVLVNYRLAPENKFPKGLEDCYAAVQWVSQHAASFGGDPEQIIVAGESAGGNLAAATAMMARDQGGPSIKFQLLLYPVTTSDLDAEAFQTSLDQYFITLNAMRMFWDLYLKSHEDGNHPYASPLKAKNLKNLPPAYILTAEYDPLKSQGEDYAERLQKAKVPVTYKCYQGTVHSFLNLPIKELPVYTKALNDIVGILAKETKKS